MKKYIKQKYLLFIGILIGIILSGATVYAATQIMATDVVYDNTASGLKKSNGEDVTNAQEALDVLSQKAERIEQLVDLKSINANGTGGVITFKYWNNNFAGSSYQFASNSIPTGSGLSGTYDSRAALASAYSSFSSTPIYIKTTQINGSTYGHTACLWYNEHEFCFGPNYWITPLAGAESEYWGNITKNQLKSNMEVALGTTASSCDSDAYDAYCYFGSFHCVSDYEGYVSCNTGSHFCRVESAGTAYCN